MPLLAVAIPLARFLPALLDLVGRRRMFLGYARPAARRARPACARAGRAADDLLRELDRIEESVSGEKESVVKAGELYTFRAHVRMVRESVLRACRSSRAGGPSAVAAKTMETR